ncbi:MAG: MATE family efflux transporter [Clostridia bacterium]|nr:MATE family efflux transporter [Clostridia bacterium]
MHSPGLIMMTKQSERALNLGEGSIPSLMIRLALPSVIAQTINMLYNMVDRMYIGAIPDVGAYALTGVGLTLPLITLISAFSSLFGTGGAPLASIKLGEGNEKAAGRILGVSAFMLMCTSAILFLFIQLAMNPLLIAFGASENTLPYAGEYLRIYLFGTAFVQLVMGLNPFISAQGCAKEAMLSVVIGAVLNIALDPLFIFTLGMGVRGAALATVISQGFSFLWVLCFLSGRQARIRLTRSNLRFDRQIFMRTISLGVSPFTMTFTESAIQVVLNRGMMLYGGDMYVGTMTIISSVVHLFSTPLHGYTHGVQPLLSFNYGAGNIDRVRRAFRLLLLSTVAITMSYCALIELFPRPFIRLFAHDEALIELTVRGLRIYAAGLGIFGLQNAVQSMFVGLGQAKISFFIAVLRKVILLIPLALVLPHFIGVNGVYLAEPIADITSATTATCLMLYHFGRILKRRQQALASH